MQGHDGATHEEEADGAAAWRPATGTGAGPSDLPVFGPGQIVPHERLGLLPTVYAPFLIEAMVRLGAQLPFAEVDGEVALLFGLDSVRGLSFDGYGASLERIGRNRRSQASNRRVWMGPPSTP